MPPGRVRQRRGCRSPQSCGFAASLLRSEHLKRFWRAGGLLLEPLFAEPLALHDAWSPCSANAASPVSPGALLMKGNLSPAKAAAVGFLSGGKSSPRGCSVSCRPDAAAPRVTADGTSGLHRERHRPQASPRLHLPQNHFSVCFPWFQNSLLSLGIFINLIPLPTRSLGREEDAEVPVDAPAQDSPSLRPLPIEPDTGDRRRWKQKREGAAVFLQNKLVTVNRDRAE